MTWEVNKWFPLIGHLKVERRRWISSVDPTFWIKENLWSFLWLRLYMKWLKYPDNRMDTYSVMHFHTEESYRALRMHSLQLRSMTWLGFTKYCRVKEARHKKSVPCTQSPQIAKVICAIRSQHVISVGLGSDSEGVREGPSLDSEGGSVSWPGCYGYSVAKSCPTLCNSMDCSPPGSSVLEILLTRIVEWVAVPSSRRSSWPRDWTCISYISCIVRRVLYC